jgi:dipeptidyl aminopeptidase/acylaminoacyl peptidase
VLPNGRTVIFTSNTTSVTYDEASIMAQSLAGGAPKVILRGGYAARYVASGHLLYVHKGALFAVTFDPDRLEVTGTPVVVVDRIAGAVGGAGAQFSVSRNGTLVYLPGAGPDIMASLVLIDATGRREQLRAAAPYIAPRFSPDGRQLALQISEGGRSSIWVYDLARGVISRLTGDSGADEVEPIWTRDGDRIVFSSDRVTRGRPHLFSKRVDSSDAPVRLTDMPRTEHEDPGTVLADGRTIVFSALTNPSAGFEIVKASLAVPGNSRESSAAETLVNDRFEQYVPTVSRDGRWLAYVSDETGRPEVFMRRFPELDGKEQISPDGGGSPTWSPTTNELFYRSRDNQQIMVVSYGSSGTTGKSRVWAEVRLADFGKLRNFDVHPDGKRIVVVEAADRQTGLGGSRAIIYFDFFDELRRVARLGR